ncbi:hypothetical protein SAMN04487972_102264 [Paracoccus halophilus]|uniref:Lipoprotein n=1 Tax=Paracoccus halophilus TaxID=376733 RepID=A0A099F8W5_9RHOB|nr:hypothetical protein [Paracoccus halophilus]KGJ06686.1 hypothetical protein IT41_00470 [Paracoccus halophilus]SFA42185.1 hypothetical protein SAMN04487972_102264 [Paracoccus halophilus]
MFSIARNTTGRHRFTAPLGVLIAAGFALGACSLDTARGPMTSADPTVFYAELAQENLTGVYNPLAYRSEDVQKGLAQVCGNRRITEYRERPAGEMVAFFGHCWGGTDVLMGTVSFRRMGNRLRIRVPGYIDRDRRNESRAWSIRL